jgi:asparagine synthase (glutamine-hydrolysing)
MESADARQIIRLKEEIYSYVELRRELKAVGRVCRTRSDRGVLLHLYARFGEARAARVRGMFAFVICDSVAQRLFLARDPYGIQPLYVADDGRHVDDGGPEWLRRAFAVSFCGGNPCGG